MNELQRTKEWFEQAILEPTNEQKSIQVGCHYEEMSEMADSLGDNLAMDELNSIADEYKTGEYAEYLSLMSDKAKIPFLDSLVDQIVTATGVAHMMGFDILGALAEVNRSNFSKFEDGKPVFDSHGKITKGKNYTPPELNEYIK